MKIKRNMSCAALLAGSLAAAVITTNTAHADSASWTGAVDGSWANVNNWAGPPASVPGAGQVATFNIGSAGGVIDLGAGVTISQLRFEASAPTLTIGAGAVNSQTLALTGGDGISGGGNSAGQTLTINAALSVTGASPRFISISQPTVTINGNLTTSHTSGTTMLRLNDSGISLNGVVSNGASALFGLTLQQNAFNLTNAGNSFTGGIQLDNASANITSISTTGNNSAIGAGGLIGLGNGFGFGTLTYSGTGGPVGTTDRTVNLSARHGGRLTQSGTGLLKFEGDVTSTTGNTGATTLQLQGSTAGTGEISGSIKDDSSAAAFGTSIAIGNAAIGSSSITIASVDGIEVGASITGTRIAPGTTITAVNPATRAISLSQPTIDGQLNANTVLTIDGVYNPTHVLKSGTGQWTLSGANTYSGNTTVTGGFLTLTNSSALQNSTLNTAGSNAGTNTSGFQTTVTTLTVGGLSGDKDLKSVFQTDVTAGGYNSLTALTLNSTTMTTPTYSAGIEDGAAGMMLIKTGAGTQILSGTNTYTGSTTVSAGTLLVNGSLTDSAVTVDGGAFGGTGSIGSTLDLVSGSFHIVDLFNALVVAGEVTIYNGFGVNNLVGLDWSTVSAGTYTLIAGDLGTGVFGGLANNSPGSAYDIGGGLSAYFHEGSLQLIIIPEPGAALLGSLGLLALLRRRRD